MKTFFSIATIIAIALQLSACATSHKRPIPSHRLTHQGVIPTTKHRYPPKNPDKVAFFTQKTPDMAYRVIGLAKVYKRTLLGAPREEVEVHTMMKKLAASIGGDGIINIKETSNTLQGHVIVFQKIVI